MRGRLGWILRSPLAGGRLGILNPMLLPLKPTPGRVRSCVKDCFPGAGASEIAFLGEGWVCWIGDQGLVEQGVRRLYAEWVR